MVAAEQVTACRDDECLIEFETKLWDKQGDKCKPAAEERVEHRPSAIRAGLFLKNGASQFRA